MQASTAPDHSAGSPPSAPSSDEIVFRVLCTLDEFRSCVALQREIWGEEYDDIVPASLMRACAHVGALTVGACASDGTLLGFVFSVPGVVGGEPVHWSHMLGVTARARGRGIGRRLKEVQRAQLAQRGVARIFWTFDPLQARNAHLNLNRLHARVVEYVTDMYGASRSPLHHGVGTDRLVVESLTAAEGSAPPPTAVDGEDAPVMTPFPRPGDAVPVDVGTLRVALIEVPWDLQEVVATSPGDALQWRAATRTFFQWAFEHHYAVTGLRREAAARRAFFVIERGDVAQL